MREAVLNLIAEMLGLDRSCLNDGTRIEEIPGFDSLQFVVLISELQERYGISIPIERALEMQTLSDLLGCVEGLSRG